MNTGRSDFGGNGTQTSALGYGGYSATAYGNFTESWNGSSWTEVNDLNQSRRVPGGIGADNTAALCFGGFRDPPPEAVAFTENWNGSSWTEVNDMTLANNSMAGSGTSTAGLSFGGNSPRTSTQSWNGTNWSNENDLNTGRSTLGGAGSQTLGLAFGGDTPGGVTAATEEWYGTGLYIETLTTTED